MLDMNSHSHSCLFQKALWSTTYQEASNQIYSTVPVIWWVIIWHLVLGKMSSDCCTTFIKHYILLTIRSVCNRVNYATHHHNHVPTPSMSIIIYFHGLLFTCVLFVSCSSMIHYWLCLHEYNCASVSWWECSQKVVIFVTNTSNKKRKVVATMQQKLAILQQDKG